MYTYVTHNLDRAHVRAMVALETTRQLTLNVYSHVAVTQQAVLQLQFCCKNDGLKYKSTV